MSEQLTQTRVVIAAPLTGVLVPLDQVPDPVFARRMVGDGFSIDPLSNVLMAPVAGEVIDLQPSHHAVTIRTPDGLEILMHIGLDTVSLLGEGFTPRTREGVTVEVGDPLIEFDLDAVGRAAKSLLTQVVITNMELVGELSVESGLVEPGEVAATVGLAVRGEGDADTGVATTAGSEAIIVPNPTGLHARPTATLVNLAKRYRSDIRLRRGYDSANAKSIVSIMGMAVAHGEKVVVTAHGSDSDDAVAAIAEAIRGGLGEEIRPAPTTPRRCRPSSTNRPPSRWPPLRRPRPAARRRRLTGARDRDRPAAAPRRHRGGGDRRRPPHRAAQAQHRDRPGAARPVCARAEARTGRLPEKAAIFAAHREILQDPELLDIAVSAIDKGKSAPSPGGPPTTPSPTSWRGSRTRCSPAAPTTCATSGSGCSRS
ncbi:glucose PTS transporter subunit IIA [Tessaracoccus coleopterorum]|uniref:glucose PTS transporter subunit IIA n=1 Tax=Tessaracoccus coleopterorum TaxID=2714950 RepID=UPI001E2B4B56|nr:glucose PTS transporter subunit IIA [Tessaracoccus coleopterorum]